MNAQKLLYWVLVLISVATLISGVVQIFAPGFILGLISAEITPSTMQGFGTIGMFMALFGGMLLHVLLTRQVLQPVFLWAALQKIGAFVAVVIGVTHHLFGPLALGIASFDLLSGILIFVYMKMVNNLRSLP
jgi:pheromone shutdown protein TraB